MKIHQYTSIDSLALILKNKTIRFNRLDNMDDVEEEAKSSLGIRLGGFMFASCWTYSSKESIPLWKMYTPSSRGVRITLDKNMFKKYLISEEDTTSSSMLINKELKVESIIPLSKMYTDNYTILNTFWNEDFFYKQIQYVDDIKAIYNSLIQVENGIVSFQFNNVGAFKHKDWDFQDECRFRLLILPHGNISVEDPRYVMYILECIQKENYAPMNSYYLNLKENILDELTITLSPFATESDRAIVNTLCKEYAPNAIIADSSLKNRVRLK